MQPVKKRNKLLLQQIHQLMFDLCQNPPHTSLPRHRWTLSREFICCKIRLCTGHDAAHIDTCIAWINWTCSYIPKDYRLNQPSTKRTQSQSSLWKLNMKLSNKRFINYFCTLRRVCSSPMQLLGSDLSSSNIKSNKRSFFSFYEAQTVFQINNPVVGVLLINSWWQ